MLVVKDDIVKYVKIINTDCRYVLWFKLSKVILNTKDDLLCGGIYIPSKGSKYSSLDCFSDIDQELLSITKDKENIWLVILLLELAIYSIFIPSIII